MNSLPPGWRMVRAEDVAASGRSIVSGPFGSNIGKRFFVAEGVPLIRGNNLTFGEKRFKDEGFVFITEEKAHELRNCEALPGDLIFTAAGTLGQVGLIPKYPRYSKYIISNKQMRLRPNPEVASAEYLFYCFTTPQMRSHIEGVNTGSSIPLINLSILRSLPIALPPLPTQHQIADILSAYDDLIENNARRIKILEEMAQAIYREWFVKYRFPGHEQAAMVETELGSVPEGWRVTRLGEVSTLRRGKSYRSQDLTDAGGLPFLNLKCIERGGGFRYDGIKRYRGDFKENQTAKPGDVVVAVTDVTQERRIVAHAARVPSLDHSFAVMSMDLVRVEPLKEIAPGYLHGLLRFSDFSETIKQHANGVNVLHLSPGQIQEFNFVLPPTVMTEAYARVADDLYRQCDVLYRKNANLRQTRDILLPKLVSGEMDASQLHPS